MKTSDLFVKALENEGVEYSEELYRLTRNEHV